MIQIEVQKLQLQINIDLEAIDVANQAKVKLYDQLIEEGPIELGEALENAEAKFRRWHFEQVKNYVNVLDVAYQRRTLDEETKDDTTIEREVKQVKEEGKSIEAIEKGKQIPTNVNIVDIFDEDEAIPFSQLYYQSAIKEKPSNQKHVQTKWEHLMNKLRDFKGQKLVHEEREQRFE